MVCQLAKPIGRQPQLLAMAGVFLVAVRDDGVDPVVAAVELDHDEHAAVAVRLRRQSPFGEETRQRRGERDQGRTLQGSTTREHGTYSNR